MSAAADAAQPSRREPRPRPHRPAGASLRPAVLRPIACVLLCAALGGSARAAGPRDARPRVTVQIPDELPCLRGLDRAAVRRLLVLELGAQLAPDAAADAGITRAVVGCDGAHVDLYVDDPVTGKALRRGIEPGAGGAGAGAGELAERILALALAELIFASWAELLVTPHPRVPPAAPRVPDAARAATSARVSQKLPGRDAAPAGGLRLLAVGGASVLLSSPAWLFGGGLRLGGDHARHFSWDVGAEYQRGREGTPLGAVTTDLLSLRLALLAHLSLPHLTLRAGAGLRAGAARLAGVPAGDAAVGSELWGAWGGPILHGGLTAGAQRLRIDLGLEGGYVVWPVGARVGGVRAVAVEGPWLGLSLGIGALLGPTR